MKKLFLIIGAPGSGKTTDAEIIAKNNNNITHYSTGDLLREQIATKSSIGEKINNFVSKGNLVPIEVVIEVIINAIKNSDNDNIIIDGYPRSVEQMNKLDEYISKENDINLINVIEVEVSVAVAKERVLDRARGDDDSEEVFNNRMKVFTDPLQEIRDFYTKKDILTTINGERTIEEIVAQMQNFILKRIEE
jgi:adenylate kinase